MLVGCDPTDVGVAFAYRVPGPCCEQGRLARAGHGDDEGQGTLRRLVEECIETGPIDQGPRWLRRMAQPTEREPIAAVSLLRDGHRDSPERAGSAFAERCANTRSSLSPSGRRAPPRKEIEHSKIEANDHPPRFSETYVWSCRVTSTTIAWNIHLTREPLGPQSWQRNVVDGRDTVAARL